MSEVTAKRDNVAVDGRRRFAIECPDVQGLGTRWIGDRERLATLTSVRMLDRHRLVVASLVGNELLLARFDDAGRGSIMDRCTTTDGVEPGPTDLLDHDGKGRIVTSDCGPGTVSLYQVDRDRLRHVRTVEPGDRPLGFCHGARFVPGQSDVVCASFTTRGAVVAFVDVARSERLAAFQIEGWRPKHTGFLRRNVLVVAYSSGNATLEPGEPYRSALAVIRVVGGVPELLHWRELLNTHVDSVDVRGRWVVVNDQAAGEIALFKARRWVLEPRGRVAGFDFPHGLHLGPGGTLAVTNYGDSSVVVVPRREVRAAMSSRPDPATDRSVATPAKDWPVVAPWTRRPARHR